jgi:hypothetical protein
MRFLNRPELALRDHRDGREDDRAILSTLETERLARIALAQRDLPALADDLDLDPIVDRGFFLHAIMLSCQRALRKNSAQGLQRSRVRTRREEHRCAGSDGPAGTRQVRCTLFKTASTWSSLYAHKNRLQCCRFRFITQTTSAYVEPQIASSESCSISWPLIPNLLVHFPEGSCNAACCQTILSPNIATDCIAAILTLRAGRESDSWDPARFAFATTTGVLVSNAVRWFKSDGGSGVPPIINVVTLSNLAWLKKPAGAAPLLKLHELVAMCSAALRPHRALWDAFIRHLRALEDRGTLTSDEAVAVVASQLTQTLLLDVEELHGPDEEADAQTLSEVVARIQAKNREEIETKIAAAQAEATQRHEQVSQSANERIAVAQARAGSAEEQHRQW